MERHSLPAPPAVTAGHRRSTWDVQRRISTESSLPIVLTVGKAHIMRFANRAFAELVGTAAGSLEGAPVYRVLGRDHRLVHLLDKVYRCAVADVVRNVRFLAPGKAAFPGTLIAWPVLDPDDVGSGDTQGAEHGLGLTIEVLAPRRTRASPGGEDIERELQEANERLILAGLRAQASADEARRHTTELKALLDNLTEGITVFNANNDVVFVNPVGRDILGFTADQPSLNDYRACDFRETDGTPFDVVNDLVRRMLRGERFSEKDVVVTRPDGTSRHLVISGSAVCDDTGKPVLAINAYRDVTDLRELEQRRTQYVSLISHDLRGPLTAASLATQRLAADAGTAERRAHLTSRVMNSLERMNTMVGNLLDAHRLRAGAAPRLKLAPCDLGAVARSVTEDLSGQHGERLILREEGSVLGMWSGDELRRAIWNLVTNAIKYGAPQTPITMTVRNTSTGAAVDVHNWGSVIPENEQALLFKPFSRREAAAAEGITGWGLGLTLVRGCAEAHGGQVHLSSTGSAGTTFTITLPLDSSLQLH